MGSEQKEKMQRGMAVLSVTMVVLAVVTIITFFSARIIVTDNKIYQNQENAADAFNAAQSGLDYALAYLNAASSNQNAIIVSASGLNRCTAASSTICLASGTVQSCTPTAPTSTLPNGATYTMKYACTAVNNITTLDISSRGVSPDGTSNKTLTNRVYRYFGGGAPIVAYGSGAGTVTLAKTTSISNTVSGSYQTVTGYTTTNGYATLSSAGGGATTSTSVGSPYSCSGTGGSISIPPARVSSPFCLDINYSDTSIKVIQSASSPAQTFQQTYLGKTITSFSSTANYVLNCTANASYTALTFIDPGAACTCTGTNCATTLLNGLNGRTVYWTMNGRTLTFNGITVGTSGSPTYLVSTNASSVSLQNTNKIIGGVYTDSPVIMVSSSSNNGAVFTSSTFTANSSSTTTGSVYAQTVTLNSGSSIIYNGTDGVLGGSSVPQFGTISGSWRDF